MDYSKLSDFEINKRVAICVRPEIKNWTCYDVSGRACFVVNENTPKRVQLGFSFTSDPADAWPIIQKNLLRIVPVAFLGKVNWVVSRNVHSNHDANPLRAAMITFLMMQESANVPANSTGSDIR
ncbi:DUF2591 family protein [Citrobacter freundii]|nr:DUF2591 family protein [Citrobacter freundii]